MKKILLPLLIVMLVALVVPEAADACPNCKESYMEGGQSPVASGFNTSIVFMMVMPFIVIGVFVLRLWVARRAGRDDSADASFTEETH